MIIICPVCGKKHNRYPSEAHHTACSNECGAKLRLQNIIHRIEKKLRYMYVIEMKGFREIEKETGVCVKTLRKCAVTLGIPIRHGSDAIASQWVGAEERKKSQSKRFRKFTRTHGKSDEYTRLINSGGHNSWRESVKKRDGYKCTKCGVTSGLAAHHLIGIIANPSLRLDISNGVTLCRKCHIAIHLVENKKFHSQ